MSKRNRSTDQTPTGTPTVEALRVSDSANKRSRPERVVTTKPSNTTKPNDADRTRQAVCDEILKLTAGESDEAAIRDIILQALQTAGLVGDKLDSFAIAASLIALQDFGESEQRKCLMLRLENLKLEKQIPVRELIEASLVMAVGTRFYACLSTVGEVTGSLPYPDAEMVPSYRTDELKRFINSDTGGKTIVIGGPSGTGKTCMALGLGLKQDMVVVYGSAGRWFMELKDIDLKEDIRAQKHTLTAEEVKERLAARNNKQTIKHYAPCKGRLKIPSATTSCALLVLFFCLGHLGDACGHLKVSPSKWCNIPCTILNQSGVD